MSTTLPEPVLLNGYRRILQTIYEPRQYLDRVLTMFEHRTEIPQKPGWVRPRLVLGIDDADRRLAGAGHHFIEYTRRVVLPRLAEGPALALSPQPVRSAEEAGA